MCLIFICKSLKKKDNEYINRIHACGRLKQFFENARVSSKLAIECGIAPKTLQRLKVKINRSAETQHLLINFIDTIYSSKKNKVFDKKIKTDIDNETIDNKAIDNKAIDNKAIDNKAIDNETINETIDNDNKKDNLLNKIEKLEVRAHNNNRVKFNLVIDFLDKELQESLEKEFPHMELKKKASLLHKLTQYLEFKESLIIREEQLEHINLYKQLQVEKEQNALLTDRIRLIELTPKQ